METNLNTAKVHTGATLLSAQGIAVTVSSFTPLLMQHPSAQGAYLGKGGLRGILSLGNILSCCSLSILNVNIFLLFYGFCFCYYLWLTTRTTVPEGIIKSCTTTEINFILEGPKNDGKEFKSSRNSSERCPRGLLLSWMQMGFLLNWSRVSPVIVSKPSTMLHYSLIQFYSNLVLGGITRFIPSSAAHLKWLLWFCCRLDQN